MSSEFLPTKLGEVLDFANGKTSPERSNNGRWPVYGSNGIIGTADATNSIADTIVIGRVGSYCGSVYLSATQCWVTDNAIRGTAKGNNSAVFLFYLLKHLNLNNWRSGSGQPLLNQSILNSIDVYIPEPPEQQEIGTFLSCIDDRIALLRETNTTLEAIAQALFKSWFVDFDPVHANAGTQPSSLATELQTLFPTTFTDTPQGPVPEGWRVDTLESISEILNGFAFKSEDYVNDEDGVFVLRTTNFNSDGYATRLEKDVFLPDSFIASHAKFVCQPFDFHLVMVGASVGNTSLLLPHMLPRAGAHFVDILTKE